MTRVFGFQNFQSVTIFLEFLAEGKFFFQFSRLSFRFSTILMATFFFKLMTFLTVTELFFARNY